ncbi:unnamed protein product, partial [Amoebophrya sp. A120]|eukprot:GSA120T00023234001.1
MKSGWSTASSSKEHEVEKELHDQQLHPAGEEDHENHGRASFDSAHHDENFPGARTNASSHLGDPDWDFLDEQFVLVSSGKHINSSSTSCSHSQGAPPPGFHTGRSSASHHNTSDEEEFFYSGSGGPHSRN